MTFGPDPERSPPPQVPKVSTGDWEPRGPWGHKYTQSEPGEATRNGSVSETLVSASSKEHASWLETVRSSTGCACTFERYFVPSKNRVGKLPFFLISLAPQIQAFLRPFTAGLLVTSAVHLALEKLSPCLTSRFLVEHS